ncbi:archease [Cystobacter ferrugineus]|uniref:Archease n=1 Tax=Cystobacter ferrugineus TaxID=83449 RepID=A0A1L9AXY1_9BACT|nr:archease [Cystobacter ferrugineus]OJH34872.1 archease [Cystobacter ferrugineus]
MHAETQPPGGGERSWGHLRHGSDIGVWGRGRTLEEAFERAGVALCAVMTEPSRVEPREAVAVCCEAPDVEVLFSDWLNALVYEMAARRMLFSRFEVHLADGRLEGRAWGEPVDVARHEPAVEVKAATLTGLRVKREEDGGWYAQCVVDV